MVTTSVVDVNIGEQSIIYMMARFATCNETKEKNDSCEILGRY